MRSPVRKPGDFSFGHRGRGAATVIPVSTDDPAGAKIAGLYPCGPLMGTAANCCLPGYNHMSFVGIKADAAAVPALDTLAKYIREGFGAVIALADIS